MQASTPSAPAPWLNFLNRKREPDSAAVFYDAAKLEWTAGIEAQWQTLRDDILHFMDTNAQELRSFYTAQQKWKSFGLYAWGMQLSRERCEKCSKTVNILRQIPGIVTIMVGVMEPHSEIAGHRGDTDAIYRCHLPLVVPGTLPEIGFQVEDEKRSWVEGKFMIFNDARFHQGWNHTDQRRVVLIIDVIKPEYRHLTMKICTHVLGSLAMQKLAQKLPFMARTPEWIQRIIHPVLGGVIALNLRFKKGTSRSLL